MTTMIRRRFLAWALGAFVGLAHAYAALAGDGCSNPCRCVSGRGCCRVIRKPIGGRCRETDYRCGVNSNCDCAGCL